MLRIGLVPSYAIYEQSLYDFVKFIISKRNFVGYLIERHKLVNKIVRLFIIQFMDSEFILI